MGAVRLDDVHLRTGLEVEAEVTGHPQVEQKVVSPNHDPQENVACSGAVSMGTRRSEEDRWRQLFPNIKKEARRRAGDEGKHTDSEDGSWTRPVTQEEEEPKNQEEEPKNEEEGPKNETHLQEVMMSLVPSPDARCPPPSPLHPPPLKPKEEEATEVDTCRRTRRGEEGCAEGVKQRGKFYDVEVTVPESDADEVTDDVTACDLASQPPECISVSAASFGLLGGGADDDTHGRGLAPLLRALRRTVLPAHWVAVLCDGPLLQLLQCSRLSTMADTIVHVQPDRCFYITVRNQRLPSTHTVYHTHRIRHLSQLVSLLLDLEQLIVCRGSNARTFVCELDASSPTCRSPHLTSPVCRACSGERMKKTMTRSCQQHSALL